MQLNTTMQVLLKGDLILSKENNCNESKSFTCLKLVNNIIQQSDKGRFVDTFFKYISKKN